MYAPAHDRLTVWPPDDTEESVLGTHLHQTTITNVRWGLNEAAGAAVPPGQSPAWQAAGQTMIKGFHRPDNLPYTTLPDVFVYRRPFDIRRTSLSLRRDGPPLLIVEVLSESTSDSDLDMERGKGYSYARGGVAEYLVLDPGGEYLPGGAQGLGWRLADGTYAPWEPDAAGRWVSGQIEVAVGFSGVWAVVYGPDGRPIPREGEVLRELAESRAAGERALLLRVLASRFGPLPAAVVAALEGIGDPERLGALADAAITAPDLERFVAALESAAG